MFQTRMILLLSLVAYVVEISSHRLPLSSPSFFLRHLLTRRQGFHGFSSPHQFLNNRRFEEKFDSSQESEERPYFGPQYHQNFEPKRVFVYHSQPYGLQHGSFNQNRKPVVSSSTFSIPTEFQGSLQQQTIHSSSSFNRPTEFQDSSSMSGFSTAHERQPAELFNNNNFHDNSNNQFPNTIQTPGSRNEDPNDVLKNRGTFISEFPNFPVPANRVQSNLPELPKDNLASANNQQGINLENYFDTQPQVSGLITVGENSRKIFGNKGK